MDFVLTLTFLIIVGLIVYLLFEIYKFTQKSNSPEQAPDKYYPDGINTSFHSDNESSSVEELPTGGTVQSITAKNIPSIIACKKPVVLVFHAEWCGACKKFLPQLQQLAANMKTTKFYSIEDTEAKQFLEQFKVTHYPTIFVVKPTHMVKYEGKMNFDDIKQFINKNC